MAMRSQSKALCCVFLGAAALLAVQLTAPAFIPQTRTIPAQAVAALGVAPAVVGSMPAFAGGPPSVGDHWIWNLGVGTLHGETASIILLVFFLLLVLSILGAGGSSKKSSA